MYVVSLIGRYADEAKAFDMQKDAAEQAIHFGTHRLATDEEISAAGFIMDGAPKESSPDKLPDGYAIEVNNGGYALFTVDENGAKTEIGFFRNAAAARSQAHADAASKNPPADPEPTTAKRSAKAKPAAPEPEPVPTPESAPAEQDPK